MAAQIVVAATFSLPAANSPLLPKDYGWFGWNIARGTAIWADSVHRLHGYDPGTVAPTSALTFHHKHAEDLYGCVDALQAAMLNDRLVVHEHRLVDAYRQVRSAVMICRPVTDSQSRARKLRGFLLPTDTASSQPASGGSFGGAEAPLIPILMDTFGVSHRAAAVLVAARRPMTVRRSRQQRDFARRWTAPGSNRDLRETLEDSLFPLDHITPAPSDLAA